MSIDSAFATLLSRLATNDDEGLSDLVFDLGATGNEVEQVPDDVVERLLWLLGDSRTYQSALAGHVLSFFQFEASHLSDQAKLRLVDFLKAHGDQFKHFHSQQVVAELRSGRYL